MWALLRVRTATIKREIEKVFEKDERGELKVMCPKNDTDFDARKVYFMECEVHDCKKIHDPKGFIKVTILRLASTVQGLEAPSTRRLRIVRVPEVESSDLDASRKRKKAVSPKKLKDEKKKPQRRVSSASAFLKQIEFERIFLRQIFCMALHFGW